MSKETTLARRIQAGARMASRLAADEQRHQSFSEWLADKSNGGFGSATPTMRDGYGLESL